MDNDQLQRRIEALEKWQKEKRREIACNNLFEI